MTNNNYLSLFPGSVLSGISVYFILSYFFIPHSLTIPAAVIVSFLVFGLAWNYTFQNRTLHREQTIFRNAGNEKINDSNTNLPLSLSDFVFVIIYLITLIITGFFANPNQDLFVPWNQFTVTQTIQLTSSILLCFFLPGYAIVDVLDKKKHELQPILKVLLAYTFSIAIIGFGGYISASLGYHTSEIKPVLLGIYIALLITFIVTKSTNGVRNRSTNYLQRLKILLNSNSPEILVFASLFALVILSTYSLYQGLIIGDQWFHHGRTLSFLGGGDRSDLDDTFYSSFSHGILASFISLSGVPSANAYSSISFLNIIPVFAFYYFFNKWVSGRNANWPKAALLACTFFILSSGFGWINMIMMSATTNPVKSPISSAELFQSVETRTLDIQRAGAFVITSSPQFGTSLTLFALPLGFVLLGLVKEKITPKIKYVIIVSTITTVGILSHDEFYLFIIVGCFLPLIFKLSERKNSMYLTFLCAMFVVAILDIIFNIKFSTLRYYTTQEVLGIPLIVLIAIIVGSVWILYASRIINRLHANVNIRQESIRKFLGARSRFNRPVLLVMVAMMAYLYVFTFLVWGQLSSADIHLQQDPYDLPWYLYPMKLGVTGLLGIAFILSYFFRKFERELFVFGLIAIIALLLGPYYDEYRLSKYIMVAMGAFASLFITRIIFSINSTHVKIVVGLVIGIIVISSSLSTLMSIGYIASAFQNPDFEQYSILLRNKIFPTAQEFDFLNYLHKNVNFKNDHIVLPLEYGGAESMLESFRDQKLANKIQGFVGTPLVSPLKFLKNPFTLNASTIQGLYSLLNTETAQYLIIPKENIVHDKIQLPVQFALENFQRAYEDTNYILLSVPSVIPPISSPSGLALIYKPEGMLLSSLISEERVLPFDNRSFNAIKDSSNANLNNKDNGTLTILNSNKRSTLWSNLLEQKHINYMETKFRTFSENNSVIGSSGIVWHSQDKEYHASINFNGLQLSERDDKFDKETILSEDQNLKTERNTWYTLKIVTVGKMISVYLDDLLKLRVHTSPSKNTDIARVGVRIDHENSEFEPIKVGHVPLSPEMSQKKEIYYNLYYPLNELALSKSAYDTFVYGDKSAFSHKTVMLPWDPAVNDTNFKDYLQFLNNGGSLIIINTGDNFTGGFSKLLNLKAGNLTEFDGIALTGNSQASHGFGVSGSARTIDLRSLNATVKSYYINDDKKVAPFAIEREYGSAGGKIIFVNGGGYFESVHKFPQRFFMSLARIPSILDIEVANYTKQNIPNNVSTGARFVGELKVSGVTTVSTSSLLLPNVSGTHSVVGISISNRTVLFNGADEKNKIKNILISNLTMSGAYKAIVEATGFVFMPSFFTPYDYIGISFPETVNLTLKMLDRSAKAQFLATVSNDTGEYLVPINIGNKEEVRFHGMGLQTSAVSNQTLIMKEPLITATGNITVNNLYIPKKGERDVILKGLNTLVDHSDIYLTKYQNASRIQYVTYLKWIQADGVPQDKPILLKLPGDISERAKRKGVQVPWEEVMVSKEGIILLLSVASVTAVALLRLRTIVK